MADHLFRLYQRNAHQLGVLHSFRTWILNYSNIAKDNASTEAIRSILESIPNHRTIETMNEIRKLQNKKLIDGTQPDKHIKEYLQQINRLINNMELKSHSEKYDAVIYNEVIFLVKEFNDLVGELSERVSAMVRSEGRMGRVLEECMFQNPKCLYVQIERLNQNLVNVVRFYLCNLHKLVEPKEQVPLLKAVSRLFVPLSDDHKSIKLKDLALINDILGFSSQKIDTHLKKQQISRGAQLGGEDNSNQFLMTKEQFIPINTISVIYHEIQGIFTRVIKNLLRLSE